ncbi:segregation and condensation protein B [bacterium BMS3Bbin02]|nr:segregation and condensation protein B [bacterium BMS3Bbin02]
MGEQLVDVASTVEAILFVAEEPVAAAELSQLLEVPRTDVDDALVALQERHASGPSGLVVRNMGGGWRLYTDPETKPYLERFAATERSARLSKAALETMAIVAYKQPISRGQVAEVRGVDSDRVLRTLERRGLIFEAGRAEGPGQAVLYSTTNLFLEKLGLASLSELPPLADHVPPVGVVDVLERPFRPEEPSNESTS